MFVGEMYTMEKHRDKPFKEYVKYIPHDKIGCLMACKAQEGNANNPILILQRNFADLIERSNCL